jgi:prevent-host-death family protein
MQTVGSYEAKTHLPALLDRAAHGEQITITRHGVPVAMLVPTEGRKPGVQETIKAMLEFRKGQRLDSLTIRELIEEGRRAEESDCRGENCDVHWHSGQAVHCR